MELRPPEHFSGGKREMGTPVVLVQKAPSPPTLVQTIARQPQRTKGEKSGERTKSEVRRKTGFQPGLYGPGENGGGHREETGEKRET